MIKNLFITGDTHGNVLSRFERFMDTYNPDTVFSSIDTYGRYAYKNQPNIMGWNLCRFAETLIPLIDENQDIAIEKAQEAISNSDDADQKWIDFNAEKAKEWPNAND